MADILRLAILLPLLIITGVTVFFFGLIALGVLALVTITCMIAEVLYS